MPRKPRPRPGLDRPYTICTRTHRAMSVPTRWPVEPAGVLFATFSIDDHVAIRTWVLSLEKRCKDLGWHAPIVTRRPLGEGTIQLEVASRAPEAGRPLPLAVWTPKTLPARPPRPRRVRASAQA